MKKSKANITGPFPTNTVLWILWQGCNGNWLDHKWFGKNVYTAYRICLEYELVNPLREDAHHFRWTTNKKGAQFLAQYHLKKLMK